MREKRPRERTKALLPPLTYHAEEILVAKNRNLSPLVIAFVYEPENIALKELGTLLGTFIVADHHEDSSYVVNCLAAAAKKEYFINSRRSVEESFESTLHKINLTLGKLVRDGHVNWIGKLHGSLTAVRDREVYFSVTGNAVILLLRNGMLSAISDGLADPEAAMHPLKTFTDISEGSLLANDKIILSTPELLELLPHALLEREAGKLPIDRFAQLLRTALINERPAAATILLDFFESPEGIAQNPMRIARETEETDDVPRQPSFIENIFSSQTFQKHPPQREASSDAPTNQNDIPPQKDSAPKEHVDHRTGHIYIQADPSSEVSQRETSFDKGLVVLREQVNIFFLNTKKWVLKQGSLLWKTSMNLLTRLLHFLVRISRTLASAGRKQSLRVVRKISAKSIEYFQKDGTIRNISFPTRDQKIILPSRSDTSIPTTRSFLSLTLQKMPAVLQSLKDVILSIGHNLLTFWNNRSKKEKLIIGGVSACILIGFWFFLFRSKPGEPTQEAPVITEAPIMESVFPPTDEPLAKEISGQEVFTGNPGDDSLQPIFLRNTLFVLSRQALINADGDTSLPLPESITPILRASAMQDLNAIFLYGQDKKMYLYYPNAKTLIENTFPLPDDFTISDMGTYLTYLYAFDAKQGRILRFPRAEGGFGAPTEWLKEKISFDENATMSIGENILIGSGDVVYSFTKGRGGAISLGETKAPTNIGDIAVANDGSFTILDTEAKRIIRYGKDGQLLGQYFSKELSDASRLTTLSNGSTTFVAIQDKILSFELQ